MNVLTYTIRLLEPLLATRIDGDPNAGVSYPFAPGSLVRGALAVAYQKRLGLDTLDAADDKTRRLFFDGRTRYLNAYPKGEVAGSPVRMLPTPLSWHTVKGRSKRKVQTIYDYAVRVPRLQPAESPEQQPTEQQPTEQQPTEQQPTEQQSKKEQPFVQFKMVQAKYPFCAQGGGQVVTSNPQRQVTVHTQRDRVYGRARTGSGAVFQYDALAAGLALRGVILLDAEGGDELAELLRGVTTLGGSANSGYGRVRIEEIELLGESAAGWRETGSEFKSMDAGGPLVVTLLSDLILRDRTTGLPSTDLCADLTACLGVPVRSVHLEDRRSAVRLVKVGGFNRRWGLPLVQSQALAAGSVLVLTTDGLWPPAKLRDLEWRGLGERRTEGFGRVAFQWQNFAQWPDPEQTQMAVKTTVEQVAATSEPPPISLAGSALQMGQWMAERMLRQELDAALQRRANQLRLKPSPSMAQINRLRVIARDALSNTDNVERLRTYVAGLEKRKSSREQFQQARVDGKRLMRWLEDHLAAPQDIWQELGVVQTSRRLGANALAEANSALAREYTIRLIDALFAKAAQDKRQEDER